MAPGKMPRRLGGTRSRSAVNDTHAMLMTMVTAIAAGSLLIIVARRLNVPAIVALLLGGILLGPETLGLA